MTTFLKWLNNAYFLAILLVAGAITDLILWGLARDLSKSDWGTWVGSIGTVATLIGTIYLATAEARQRSKDELVRARLHGASMVLRLEHAEAAVAQIKKIIEETVATASAVTFLDTCRSKLDTIDKWSIDELVPLAPLPNKTALKLARAADQINSFQKLVEKEIATGNFYMAEGRREIAARLLESLKDLQSYINEAVHVCRAEIEASV